MSRHVALIVEDEPDMAAEIADLLQSFGHGHIRVETKADALVRLVQGGFCYVLLDLQIKADRNSIRPRVETGMSLLEDIRKRFPHRQDAVPHDVHLMPVLIVSGHAKEHEDIIRALQTGADDFIKKPFGEARTIIDKVRLCLERSGRQDHGNCAARYVDAIQGGARVSAGEQHFHHAADYSQVTLREDVFLFTGDIQKAVIRILHQASKTDQPWRGGQRVLGEAGSKDAAQKMSNLFGHHPCWGKLLLSDRRGKYRLKTE